MRLFWIDKEGLAPLPHLPSWEGGRYVPLTLRFAPHLPTPPPRAYQIELRRPRGGRAVAKRIAEGPRCAALAGRGAVIVFCQSEYAHAPHGNTRSAPLAPASQDSATLHLGFVARLASDRDSYPNGTRQLAGSAELGVPRKARVA